LIASKRVLNAENALGESWDVFFCASTGLSQVWSERERARGNHVELLRSANSRGIAYCYQGKLDKAISDYSDAIRLAPNYDAAYNNRGYAYYKQREFAKAIGDYNEAIQLDPNFAIAYKNRGDAYRRAGDQNKANADFLRARQLEAGL